MLNHIVYCTKIVGKDFFMDEVKEKINVSEDNISQEENIQNDLFKELNVLNISYIGVILVFIGVIINIRFILWSRIKILDNINNTNYSEQIGDLTEFPKISNRLYLVATILFVIIIYDQYKTQVLSEPSEGYESAVNDAWNRYVAIVLFLVGTLIYYSILNKPNS